MDFDLVNLGVFPDAKVQTSAIVTLVTAPAVDFIDQDQISTFDLYGGADTISVCAGSAEL